MYVYGERIKDYGLIFFWKKRMSKNMMTLSSDAWLDGDDLRQWHR